MSTSLAYLSRPAREILRGLPPLPTALRYYDDFLEKFHSIRDPARTDDWVIRTDGEHRWIRFSEVDPMLRVLLKHVIVDFFGRMTAVTVARFGWSLIDLARAKAPDLFESSLTLPPGRFRDKWLTTFKPNLTYDAATSAKAYLDSLCRLSIGPWHPGLEPFVGRMLPRPRQDAYRVVRTGDCFVPLDQQSLITDFLDEIAALITRTPDRVTYDDLRDACILLITSRDAFRPKQVAKIKRSDVRVYNTGAVHFTARLGKQKDQRKLVPVTRRVKREWCPLMIEFVRRRDLQPSKPAGVSEDSLLGLTPRGISRRIKALAGKLTSEKWTPTDMRHTAAQRLVDAGASHITVAEFMGHSDLRTAGVYFDTSPTQAQRANDALVISLVYSTVAEVARTRTIDKKTLLALPPDQRIGGAPHGIPIAGIGGCAVGQSMCAKNPVLSCYTCRKFMPLNDARIHRQVVDEMRPVVLDFVEASRGDTENPAYMQLRGMLNGAQRIIADIESEGPSAGE